MITIFIVFGIIALVFYLSFNKKTPLVNVFSYILTAIVAFGVVLVGINTYHGSGSYGSFGSERPNQTLGILIFIWAFVVACSTIVARKYNKPKLSFVIVALGAFSIILIPILQFLT